jgi:hypothetical protein
LNRRGGGVGVYWGDGYCKEGVVSLLPTDVPWASIILAVAVPLVFGAVVLSEIIAVEEVEIAE